MKKQNINLYLASPRGFCAGVDRAVKIVEQTIKQFGAPVYVRHEIVHNKDVVNSLAKIGAIFVNLSSYLVMPIGFVWGYLFFDETFTFIKFLSTLLICISIFMLGKQKYKIKNIPIE